MTFFQGFFIGFLLATIGLIKVFLEIKKAYKESLRPKKGYQKEAEATSLRKKIISNAQFFNLKVGQYFIYQGKSWVVLQKIKIDDFNAFLFLEENKLLLLSPSLHARPIFLEKATSFIEADTVTFFENLGTKTENYFSLPNFPQKGKWRVKSKKQFSYQSEEQTFLERRGEILLFLLQNIEIGQYCLFFQNLKEEADETEAFLFFGNALAVEREIEEIGFL
jgi:hypothetical protein